jgi:histone-lysine N-methyltransferase SUV39H
VNKARRQGSCASPLPDESLFLLVRLIFRRTPVFIDMSRLSTMGSNSSPKNPDVVITAGTLNIAKTIEHDGQAKAGTKTMLMAHFVSHERGIAKYAQEEARCHYCQFRKFSTHEKYPIAIINNVDEDGLPETFRFVDRVVPSANIPVTEEEFITGCECDADYEDHCVFETCSCMGDIDSSQIQCKVKVNAYHKTGLLRTAYLKGRFPLYECGPKCTCGPECPNRVVQRGRTVPLQIFKTKDGRGWGKVFSPIPRSSFTNLLLGVKAVGPIIKGHFVDCYFGELLTQEEAQVRRDGAASVQQKDVYLFALDKFTDPNAADERLHVPYEIDGEFMSGPTRFINHSCDPNLRIFAVVKHSADQPFHGLAFFAVKDITENTELTFDYLDGVTDGVVDNKQKRKCLCGAKRCRGYLF